MSEVIIGTTIGGTVSDPTGMAFQSHLVWAVNDSAWWLFYVGSSSTNTVQTFRSPDGVTWTAKTASGTLALVAGGAATLNGQGRNLGCAYKNISGNDVVHLGALCVATQYSGEHNRAVTSGGAISWAGWALLLAGSSSHAADTAVLPSGCGTVLDSSNRPYDLINFYGTPNIDGNPAEAKGSNVDSGTSWTAGFAAAVQGEAVSNSSNAQCAFDVGGGTLLVLWENASSTEPSSMTNVRSSVWSGTAFGTISNVFTAFTAEDPNNFGAVALSTSDVHVVAKTGSNTFVHKRIDASGTITSGDAITNLASVAAAGIFMATDGVSVWMFVIGSDAANTISYNKWTSGSGWSGWTTFESSSKTRNFISGYPNVVNNQIGVVWTETNGSNFDVAFETLSTTPAATPPLARAVLSSSRIVSVAGQAVLVYAKSIWKWLTRKRRELCH